MEYKIVCSRCSNGLQTISVDRSLGLLVTYGGVVCSKCEKVECIACKSANRLSPCSWCGATVNPVFDGGLGPNVPSSALR
jgi:hypothetical protein